MRRFLLASFKQLGVTFVSLIAILFLTAQVAGGGVDGMIIRPLRLLTGDGSAANPAWSFFNDMDTGVRRTGANSIAWVTAATDRLTLNTSTLTTSLPLVIPAGAVGAPGLYFSGSATTGLWQNGANTLSITISGTERLRFQSNEIIPGSTLTTDFGATTNRLRAIYTGTINASADLKAGFTNNSASPGDTTINTPCGRGAIAAGTNIVVVTSSIVTSSSVVLANLAENDATCQTIRYADPNSGNFELLTNGNCTNDIDFNFCVVN